MGTHELLRREVDRRAEAGTLRRAAVSGPDALRALASAMGNRAFGEIARSAPRRQGSSGALVQRMLIEFGTEQAVGENARELRDSDPAEYREGSIKELVKGEVLHLLAHSSTAKFGPYTPKELFTWLRGQGLPPDIRAVQLHGCESATFAWKLALLLNTRSPDWAPTGRIEVRGVPGFHLVSDTGTSWSVGRGGQESEALWRGVRAKVLANRSDATLKGLAEPNIFQLENLKSSVAAQLGLRQTVKAQLRQQVDAIVAHSSDLTPQRKDAASIERRIEALVRRLGASLQPESDGLQTSREMAGDALRDARAALKSLMDDAGSEAAAYLDTPAARTALERIGKADQALQDAEATVPHSLKALLWNRGDVDRASRKLEVLAELVANASGAPSELIARFRAHLSHYDDAVKALHEAQLDAIKGPLLAKLTGLHFPADAPEPAPPTERRTPRVAGSYRPRRREPLPRAPQRARAGLPPSLPAPAGNAIEQSFDLDFDLADLDLMPAQVGAPSGPGAAPPAAAGDAIEQSFDLDFDLADLDLMPPQAEEPSGPSAAPPAAPAGVLEAGDFQFDLDS
jgi:hypothetical protein